MEGVPPVMCHSLAHQVSQMLKLSGQELFQNQALKAIFKTGVLTQWLFEGPIEFSYFLA